MIQNLIRQYDNIITRNIKFNKNKKYKCIKKHKEKK